ncbi:hypothetical protein B0H14DRAFT_2630591 [Mycena olivaceomarginata]|nr:hypothetical protein B0H14DRAFT_2630591 [Mycena olivaceomarginata]
MAITLTLYLQHLSLRKPPPSPAMPLAAPMQQWTVEEIIEGLKHNSLGEDVNNKFTLSHSKQLYQWYHGYNGMQLQTGRIAVMSESHIPNRHGLSTAHVPQGVGVHADHPHPQPGRQPDKPPIWCAHMVYECMHPHTVLCASVTHPKPGLLSRTPARFVEHNRMGVCTPAYHTTLLRGCTPDRRNGVSTTVTAQWDIDPTQQRIGCWQYTYCVIFRQILAHLGRPTQTFDGAKSPEMCKGTTSPYLLVGSETISAASVSQKDLLVKHSLSLGNLLETKLPGY